MADVNSVTTDSISTQDGKNGLYARIKAEVEKKKALYEAAKQNESIITASRNKAKSEYMTNLAEYNQTGNQTSLFLDAKKNYESYSSQYSDADLNTEVLRDSLNNSNEYLGKIGNMPSYLG